MALLAGPGALPQHVGGVAAVGSEVAAGPAGAVGVHILAFGVRPDRGDAGGRHSSPSPTLHCRDRAAIVQFANLLGL